MGLSPDAVVRALGDRPVRTYPALLATDVDAQAWARAGAPAGAVVTSDYQASPRGRSGLPWEVDPAQDLVFSLVARPSLPDTHEGWLYLAAAAGLADAVGPPASIEWPDDVRVEGRSVASLGWHVELGPGRVAWAVLTVWRRDVDDRAATLRRLVDAVEARLAQPPAEVLPDLVRRCATLGRSVRARLIPMGPAGPVVRGVASDLLDDGSLVIATPAGGRIPVTPQALGQLEPLAED